MMDGQQGRYPIKQQLKEHYDELNIYNAQKKEKLVEVDKIDKVILNLERDKARELKRVHPMYNSVELIKSGLKELNRRLT